MDSEHTQVNKLAAECFLICIDNFSISSLDSREDLCVHRCIEKFLVARAFFDQSIEKARAENAKFKKLISPRE